METENTYTIHSHIHQYAPKITVGHRRTLLAISFHGRDSEVIFTQRILRIGLPPTPTLCTFFARLLSSSQSLDFLHIDFTTRFLKSQ